MLSLSDEDVNTSSCCLKSLESFRVDLEVGDRLKLGGSNDVGRGYWLLLRGMLLLMEILFLLLTGLLLTRLLLLLLLLLLLSEILLFW